MACTTGKPKWIATRSNQHIVARAADDLFIPTNLNHASGIAGIPNH